ncbi:MAG: MaoC family dehydratase N-terminal domain-containing protein [Halovenus sp.]
MIGSSKDVVEGMHIEAGKVAEFARAIGCESPVFYEPEAAEAAGLQAIPAPLTFLRASVFQRYRPEGLDRDPVFDLGFEKSRVVHGEHSFEFERPVYVGDTLTGVATLVDVYQRESSGGGVMTFAVQEIEYTDGTGDTVATEQMTVIEVPPEESK